MSRKLAKKIQWEGTAYKDLCDAPKDVRRRAGYELLQLQYGEDPSDWKPMNTVGKAVKEIRIHTKSEYRIL